MLNICVEEFGDFEFFDIDFWFIFCDGDVLLFFFIWRCGIIDGGGLSEVVGMV